MKNWNFLTFIFLLLVLGFGRASVYCQLACPPTFGYQDMPYWRADLVFTGVVKKFSEDTKARPAPGELTISDSYTPVSNVVQLGIEKKYRGEPGDSLELVSSFPFRTGERYFVYAVASKDGKIYQLDNGFCGRPPLLLKDAKDDLEYAEEIVAGSPGTRIFGTVVEDAQRLGAPRQSVPLSGVEIKIKGERGSFTARTDEKGKYLFKNIPPGVYKLSASGLTGLRERTMDNRYYSQRGTKPFTVLLGVANKPAPLGGARKPETYFRHSDSYNFVFTSLSSVEGRVVGADGRVPPQQYVWLIPRRNGKINVDDYLLYSWTDSVSGKFVLKDIPSGEYVLVINRYNCHCDVRPEFARSFFPGVTDQVDAETIMVDTNEDLKIKDFRLPLPLKERSFSGIVLGPDGSPKAGATVILANPQVRNPNECFFVNIETTTDERGRFNLKGYDGYPYRIAALVQQPKRVSSRTLELPSARNIEDIQLILEDSR